MCTRHSAQQLETHDQVKNPKQQQRPTNSLDKTFQTKAYNSPSIQHVKVEAVELYVRIIAVHNFEADRRVGVARRPMQCTKHTIDRLIVPES